MTYIEALREELLTDPAGRGYAQAATSQAKADLLNEPYDYQAPAVTAPVDCKMLEAALMQTLIGVGPFVVWDIIQAAADGDDNPLTEQPFPPSLKRPLARVHRWVTVHPVIDLSLPAAQALIGWLVSAELLTEAQAAGLAALGTVVPPAEPRPPRICVICGHGDDHQRVPIPGAPNAASAADVEEALNG